MATERLIPLLDELAELEVFDLTFAGGEPFLHPDILQILDHAIGSGIRVALLTNGTCLSDRVRRRLARVVAGRPFILQISLDSPDPAINDLTRGRGALVARNVRAMAKLGIELQLSCVVHGRNIETAHSIIDAFYPVVKRFHFLNIQRTYRSLQHPELLVRDEQARDFWMHLKEYAKRFPPDLFLPSLRIMLRSYGAEDSAASQALNRQATFDCRSCSVGHTKVEIDWNFDVLGCDIAKDFTKMGNVQDSSFAGVWHSVEARRVRESPFPPCYQIRSPGGLALMDQLKLEYRA